MSFASDHHESSASGDGDSQSTESTPAIGFDALNADDEMLVAYLDGELDAASVSDVENKLAKDISFRRRLDELRSAWDLLEELPPVEPNPTFAQSTIEMVAMSAASLSIAGVEKRSSWRWLTASLIAIPVMFGLGYFATRIIQRFNERHAIEEIHILADWDALKAVESFQWLEELHKVPDLVHVAKRPTTSELGVGLVPRTLAERRKWVQELNPSDRDRLSANLLAFQRATPAERQRMIELAKHIYASPDPEANLQVARSYAYFLSEMSISDRAAYRDESNSETRLNDLRRRVNRRLVDVYTQDLTPESPDMVAVNSWIEDMKKEYGDALPRNSVFLDLARRTTFGYSAITERDLDDLLANLTPRAQEIIQRMQTKELQHAALILYFVNKSPQSAFPGAGMRRGIDRAKLTERFKQLPEYRRSELEFLPPESTQRWLGMRSQNVPPQPPVP